MAQTSKRFTPDDIYQEIYYFLFTSIKLAKTIDSASDFVDVILTRSEKLMVGKRVAIAFLLRKHAKYEEICHILRVSRGTVARVNSRLEDSTEFQKLIDRILMVEQVEHGLFKIVEKLSGFYADGWGNKSSGFWREMEKIAKNINKKSLLSKV